MCCHEFAEHVLLLLLFVCGQSEGFLALIEPAQKLRKEIGDSKDDWLVRWEGGKTGEKEKRLKQINRKNGR